MTTLKGTDSTATIGAIMDVVVSMLVIFPPFSTLSGI